MVNMNPSFLGFPPLDLAEAQQVPLGPSVAPAGHSLILIPPKEIDSLQGLADWLKASGSSPDLTAPQVGAPAPAGTVPLSNFVNPGLGRPGDPPVASAAPFGTTGVGTGDPLGASGDLAQQKEIEEALAYLRALLSYLATTGSDQEYAQANDVLKRVAGALGSRGGGQGGNKGSHGNNGGGGGKALGGAGASGDVLGAGGADMGGPMKDRVKTAMTAAKDQLIKEGVPAANADAAAAALIGNAVQESKLNPNLTHDGGTGYGIYGARDDPRGSKRRSKMLAWLGSNGYAKNSLEGQARYMAHEAMSGGFASTRRALMTATAQNLAGVATTVSRNFEAPAAWAANEAGRRQNAVAALRSAGGLG